MLFHTFLLNTFLIKHIQLLCYMFFIKSYDIYIESDRLGMVAYACNPSTLEGQGRWIAWGKEFETSRGNMAKPHLYRKIQKLARHGGVHL